MDVLLVNVDSTIPNLALAKLAMFHRNRGDRVRQIRDTEGSILPYPLFLDEYSRIYVSCIFSWNKNRCIRWEGRAEIGGSGYSLEKQLPADIEALNPKINQGFITRGCIRHCPWCIVPQKEGKIRQVANAYDLWDGKSDSIVIMDNNILALPRAFFETCEILKRENLMVDWNQGLDHRLLTNEICSELFSLKYIRESGQKIRFAFDHISYRRSVVRALKLLKEHGMKPWRTRWYVYVGTYDTVETVLERVNLLRDWQQAVFLMRDRDSKVQRNQEFRKIYIWTTCVEAFSKIPYEEFRRSYFTDKGNALLSL
jgi:hypothetical protein